MAGYDEGKSLTGEQKGKTRDSGRPCKKIATTVHTRKVETIKYMCACRNKKEQIQQILWK